MIIAKSRKTLSTTPHTAFATTSDQNSVVVIDMAQISMNEGSIAAPNKEIQAEEQKDNRVKILDPTTRLLERGIKVAVEMGDFNDIAAALIQGANVNHQRQSASPVSGNSILEGYTALMAASQQGNIRMLKRLLDHSADVNLKNKAGKTALDLIKVSKAARTPPSLIEIYALLQQEVARSVARAKATGGGERGRGIRHSNDLAELNHGSMFEVDLFIIDHESSHPMQESMQESMEQSSEGEGLVGSGSGSDAPTSLGVDPSVMVVPVDGLQISQEGEVRLGVVLVLKWNWYHITSSTRLSIDILAPPLLPSPLYPYISLPHRPSCHLPYTSIPLYLYITGGAADVL